MGGGKEGGGKLRGRREFYEERKRFIEELIWYGERKGWGRAPFLFSKAMLHQKKRESVRKKPEKHKES